MTEHITHNPKETEKIAREIVANILSDTKRKEATMLALYGDLGSGKTNFAQAAAKEFGVEETVPSPTFILLRAYDILKNDFTKFIHIDAYRLKDEGELHQIGWDDIKKDSRNIILVEWADRIEKAIPKNAIKIYFEHISEHERKITIKI
ncbi:MAG: tRNA (adenosine(37)-N6)-threonylcarbamoyltransferase complex ATPase subunit type 1 TsaE [Parcubacteria group bacterium]|nr:tRNA (adenosine(37)-N6)-threonylcarbamoyltransferase complex ATPase subunit type 1 TsaE [Parcubacteria group bacterium]